MLTAKPAFAALLGVGFVKAAKRAVNADRDHHNEEITRRG